MAYPTYTSQASQATSVTTTPSVALATGYDVAGNLIVVLIRSAVAGAIGWPDASWNEVFDASSDAADDQMALAWHKCTGSETSPITLSSGSGKFAALALTISGAADPTVRAPQFSTVATGSGTTPDPTTCTPTGGAKDYLWVWLGGWADESTSPPTGDPSTGYSGRIGASTGTGGLGTTNCRVAMSFKTANASSEDPGSWTISISAAWTAYCMAIHPRGGAGLFTAGGYYKA